MCTALTYIDWAAHGNPIFGLLSPMAGVPNSTGPWPTQNRDGQVHAALLAQAAGGHAHTPNSVCANEAVRACHSYRTIPSPSPPHPWKGWGPLPYGVFSFIRKHLKIAAIHPIQFPPELNQLLFPPLVFHFLFSNQAKNLLFGPQLLFGAHSAAGLGCLFLEEMLPFNQCLIL